MRWPRRSLRWLLSKRGLEVQPETRAHPPTALDPSAVDHLLDSQHEWELPPLDATVSPRPPATAPTPPRALPQLGGRGVVRRG